MTLRGRNKRNLFLLNYAMCEIVTPVYLMEFKTVPKLDYTDLPEPNSFNVEPNRRVKGHVKPFYQKGRW